VLGLARRARLDRGGFGLLQVTRKDNEDGEGLLRRF
ncbi:uncharacterized protein METZ01_LOCUS453064, partial [marine metagenome]